jgi:hypothetical protein
MYFFDNVIKLDIYSLFILILIISANFLAQLFPCKFQKHLKENMILKHIFGLFTIVFFVLLSAPLDDKSLYNIFSKSIMLYIIFTALTKVQIFIFYIILALLMTTYIIILQKNYIKQTIKDAKQENEGKENEGKENEGKSNIVYYDTILYWMYILIIILIVIGLLVYMGEKKIEYNKNFTYITFFLGKTVCKNNTEISKNMLHSFYRAFV